MGEGRLGPIELVVGMVKARLALPQHSSIGANTVYFGRSGLVNTSSPPVLGKPGMSHTEACLLVRLMACDGAIEGDIVGNELDSGSARSRCAPEIPVAGQ